MFIVLAVLIIGVILFFTRHRGKSTAVASDKDWYLQIALSKEDSVSQAFFVLAIFFLGVSLLALNRDFGDPFSWWTILLVTSIVSFATAYYLKVVYALLLSLIGITTWWGIQAFEWIKEPDIKTSAIFVGVAFIVLIFYVLGHLHEKEPKFKRFALVYLILGIVLITGDLFFLSTKLGLSALESMNKGSAFFASWQITLSLFLFFVGLLAATMYAVNQKRISLFETLAVIFLALLFGSIALLPQQNLFIRSRAYFSLSSGAQLSEWGILWAIIFNFVVFLELLGLILSGYLRREEWLINLGAMFLFLLIFVKYFDWFFTFLDKSLFFIGAGILLFGVGWLMERGRRYMISSIKTEAPQPR